MAKLWLRVFGYRLECQGTPPPKYVLIAAPHTSNWDFPFALAISGALGLGVHWMGKHTLFHPPWGFIMRRLGGVAIDRRAPQGLVQQMVARFAAQDRFALVVPPEGTRARRGHWKSGFYHIARAADVPVALAFIDFAKKTCGIGGWLHPTGDVRADMAVVRGFYRNIRGKHPERESEIRLLEESPPGTPGTPG